MKKAAHALLIPGQLRCIDDKLFNFLDTCGDNVKIFILTENEFKGQAQIMADRYGADVSYIENLTEIDIGIPRSKFNVIYPEVVKLELALRYLLLWEKKHNFSFQFIHRFRTDVLYPVSFSEYIEPIVKIKDFDNALLSYYVYNYSGPRQSMLKLIGLAKYNLQFMSDKDFFKQAISQINVEALRASEHNTAPFARSFPVGLVDLEKNIDDFHLIIKTEFPSYIEAAQNFINKIQIESCFDLIYDYFIARNFKLIRTFDKIQWNPEWPEHIFSRYVNSLGISTRSYSVKLPWRDSPMRISRHAKTPFTEKIFNSMQDLDYSFLEANHSWAEEISSFIAAGGKSWMAITKFSVIDLSMLPDSSCITLYKIIDLLDHPNYLIEHRQDFITSILSRGIDPPLCLKSYLSGIRSEDGTPTSPIHP